MEFVGIKTLRRPKRTRVRFKMLMWNQWRWSLWVWMHLVTCLFSYNLLDILQTFCSWCKSKIYTFCKTWYRGKRLTLVVLDMSMLVQQVNKVGETLSAVFTQTILSKNSTDMISLTHLLFGINLFPFAPSLIEHLSWLKYITFTFNVHYNVLNNGVSMFKTGSISNYWW